MPKNILIVDDVAVNRIILKTMICREYVVLEASSGEEALDILNHNYNTISAVLLDIIMPGIDGFEVLSRIRSDNRLSSMPVIMITGSEDDASRIRSLALGANDFVTKPYSLEIIMHCLKNNIAFREAAATVTAMQRDRLTGLYNREYFFEKVLNAVSEHAPGYYTMACYDIDKFKVINDQYGTQKGDEILRHIANTFREGFDPRGGICCHISADNFAVLYPTTFNDTPEISAISDRAAHIDGLISPIMFSVGRYIVDDITLSPAAMHDRAMLAANTIKGRYDQKVAVYNDAMRESLLREQAIVLEMEDALNTGQFEVWFQPQYNHATGAMIGAEALVRWRHHQRGLIPPNYFIPIFERNGFIYALDKFVWEDVCRRQRKWLDEGRSPLPISVNISRYDLLRFDIVEKLDRLVADYRLPYDLLRLEITESAFAESSQSIVRTVKELLKRGFTVEIDDFGSGYSSLNTLKDVPAQIIKLDMKFLASSDDSQRGGNIVESVVRMAKWLGMSVIAEGVETLEQADYLRSIGCYYVQGYLYARPVPADMYEQHCDVSSKEGRLLTLETVDRLDNNAFWDPNSMDTLIFNSYVGGACILEYNNGDVEMLRASDKYAQMISGAGMCADEALRLGWMEHLDADSRVRVVADIKSSIATRTEVTGEYTFLDLPGCPHETCLRASMRVIASVGERYLVYCISENITAQRMAEQTERRTAEQIQTIMDNIDSGIMVAAVENGVANCLFANNRYYDMLGYTKAQFESELSSPYQTIAHRDLQRIIDETARIKATGSSAVLIYNAITRDGRERVFRTTISMGSFTGADGPVEFNFVRDITEEIEAERRERFALEQIKSMMDDMPGGFIRMHIDQDANLKVVYINDGFAKMIGIKSNDATAPNTNDVMASVHPDDVDMVRNTVYMMLRHGGTRSIRYRLRHRNGKYIWLSVFGRVTKEASGETYLNAYYTDVTEQVSEEETQRKLLDNLPCGAGVYELKDGQMSLTYQNKSYWDLVGLHKADFPDPSPMSAIYPDDIPVVMQDLAQAIANHRGVACDIRLRHLTQGYIPVRLAGRIVYKDVNDFIIYATFTPQDQMGLPSRQIPPAVPPETAPGNT